MLPTSLDLRRAPLGPARAAPSSHLNLLPLSLAAAGPDPLGRVGSGVVGGRGGQGMAAGGSRARRHRREVRELAPYAHRHGPPVEREGPWSVFSAPTSLPCERAAELIDLLSRDQGVNLLAAGVAQGARMERRGHDHVVAMVDGLVDCDEWKKGSS